MPSFGFELDASGRSFRNSSGRYAKVSETMFQRALEAGRVAGSATAKSEAPKKTGSLAKSIRATKHGSSIRISASTPYAETIELGAGELEIGPALMRFFWVNRGRMFTGPATKMYPDNTYVGRNWPAIVTRPAFQPQPYLQPGLEAAEEAMVAYLKRNL